MSLVRINRHPSPRDLRVFASLWLVFVGVAGALCWRQGWTGAALAAWAVAALVFAAGMVAPWSLRLVYLSAVYAAFPIGVVVSYLVLGAVYFLLMTPVGWLMRLAGHDPLERRFDPAQKSYWKARGRPKSAHSYFRQH